MGKGKREKRRRGKGKRRKKERKKKNGPKFSLLYHFRVPISTHFSLYLSKCKAIPSLCLVYCEVRLLFFLPSSGCHIIMQNTIVKYSKKKKAVRTHITTQPHTLSLSLPLSLSSRSCQSLLSGRMVRRCMSMLHWKKKKKQVRASSLSIMSMALFWAKHHHTPHTTHLLIEPSFSVLGDISPSFGAFSVYSALHSLGILVNGICSVSLAPVVNWRQENTNHVLPLQLSCFFSFPCEFYVTKNVSDNDGCWIKVLVHLCISFSFAPFIEKTKFVYFISVSFGLLLLRMTTLTPREGALCRKRERQKTGTLIAW